MRWFVVYIYIYTYMYYYVLFFVLSFLFLFSSALIPVAGAAYNGIRTHYPSVRVGVDISCPRNFAMFDCELQEV
jgi:hypothetical protein